MAQKTKKTDEQISAILKRAITEAKDHVSGDVEAERLSPTSLPSAQRSHLARRRSYPRL